ncbi:MAG: hypothetical protein EOP06_23695 [Proteobacteria bacterium]|nr:MAG: hypothetical protein EOP06_23695 [Pseudomonadota bacterium]
MQELGHDLRTPLTSLATSFETLRVHSDKMTVSDREELFEMTAAEVEYLKDLLEKLMTIAALDEPNYRQSTEIIDLGELLSQEIRKRQASSKIHWSLHIHPMSSAFVAGDFHLLLRMFRNAFDNAARYANQEIQVSILNVNSTVDVTIVDDGPGLSVKDLESFAKRREQRTKREGEKLNFSLGLGSVIMKAISESHDGSIEIANRTDAPHGASLKVSLPAAR